MYRNSPTSERATHFVSTAAGTGSYERSSACSQTKVSPPCRGQRSGTAKDAVEEHSTVALRLSTGPSRADVRQVLNGPGRGVLGAQARSETSAWNRENCMSLDAT